MNGRVYGLNLDEVVKLWYLGGKLWMQDLGKSDSEQSNHLSIVVTIRDPTAITEVPAMDSLHNAHSGSIGDLT